jgi:hypothetical protein
VDITMSGANGEFFDVSVAFCGGTKYFFPPDKEIFAPDFEPDSRAGPQFHSFTVSVKLRGRMDGSGWFSSRLGGFSTVSQLRGGFGRWRRRIWSAEVGVFGQESAECFRDRGQIYEQALDGRG